MQGLTRSVDGASTAHSGYRHGTLTCAELRHKYPQQRLVHESAHAHAHSLRSLVLPFAAAKAKLLIQNVAAEVLTATYQRSAPSGTASSVRALRPLVAVGRIFSLYLTWQRVRDLSPPGPARVRQSEQRICVYSKVAPIFHAFSHKSTPFYVVIQSTHLTTSTTHRERAHTKLAQIC